MKFFPRSEALNRNNAMTARRSWYWSIDGVNEDANRSDLQPTGRRVSRG